MKKSFPTILLVGLIGLSGFKSQSADYEQKAFDYFVSDILRADFQDVTSFEFKGHTEESFSTLKKYEFCLQPEEKLGSMIRNTTKGLKREAQKIEFKNIEGLKITDFQAKTNGYRLFVYPSLRVADNYYVFVAFQKQKEQPIRYVFEVTPEGEISRSCKME
jgi:hypothetical protein